jgi:hypothetical protein
MSSFGKVQYRRISNQQQAQPSSSLMTDASSIQCHQAAAGLRQFALHQDWDLAVKTHLLPAAFSSTPRQLDCTAHKAHSQNRLERMTVHVSLLCDSGVQLSLLVHGSMIMRMRNKTQSCMQGNKAAVGRLMT